MEENILAEKYKNIPFYILNYLLSNFSYDSLINIIQANEKLKNDLIETWKKQHENEFISIKKYTKQELEANFEKLSNQLGKEKFYFFLFFNQDPEISFLKNKIDINFFDNKKNDLNLFSLERFREIIKNKDKIINNLHQKNDYFFRNIKEKNKEIDYFAQENKQLKTEIKNLENLYANKNKEIISESIPPKENLMDKYKQVTSLIIFDVSGGIIKTEQSIITLSHQEMKRTNANIGDNVLVIYNPTKPDEWGRYVGKIIKKIDFEEIAETNFKEEQKEKMSIQEIATIMQVTSIPEKTFIKILDDFKIKYTLVQNNFIFSEDIKEIVKQILEKIEIFEICDSESCKKYCQEEHLFYKNINNNQYCDICGKLVEKENVIEKIINIPKVLEKQKIVFIGGQIKLKYCYILECKKIGIDVWWHDGIHEMHRLDGIIKNCNGVLFLYNDEKLYNSFKKTEIICNHYQKKMIKINYVGFNKVKKTIEENFIIK